MNRYAIYSPTLDVYYRTIGYGDINKWSTIENATLYITVKAVVDRLLITNHFAKDAVVVIVSMHNNGPATTDVNKYEAERWNQFKDLNDKADTDIEGMSEYEFGRWRELRNHYYKNHLAAK